MANNQIFYDMATKEFIRTKSTNNTRVMTAPPSNNQWSMSIYMSIQDYFMLFFFGIRKNIVWHTIIIHIKYFMIQDDRLIKISMHICIYFGSI